MSVINFNLEQTSPGTMNFKNKIFWTDQYRETI